MVLKYQINRFLLILGLSLVLFACGDQEEEVLPSTPIKISDETEIAIAARVYNLNITLSRLANILLSPAGIKCNGSGNITVPAAGNIAGTYSYTNCKQGDLNSGLTTTNGSIVITGSTLGTVFSGTLSFDNYTVTENGISTSIEAQNANVTYVKAVNAAETKSRFSLAGTLLRVQSGLGSDQVTDVIDYTFDVELDRALVAAYVRFFKTNYILNINTSALVGQISLITPESIKTVTDVPYPERGLMTVTGEDKVRLRITIDNPKVDQEVSKGIYLNIAKDGLEFGTDSDRFVLWANLLF